MRQVLLYTDETGMWVVVCPSLPGCISQGATREEALANIRDAIQQYIASLIDEGEPVPEDRYQAEVIKV